ncbi:hypothetical protein BTA51_03380 [Hahella sp. CCB-MM4]|uniref:PP2C family protein-serine/threonine phosphatase n=1 Tax=Hahella sp. (strain CCB-MM4) TaxID=1926491 RepID=UPI000B9AF96A|nr:PP2C family serine/threonine-protein phosphatase [Hahella sp. CCB-MM4]OZG75429.1 hypothetical protein BTA51_03380 [Hahella sp. CCB-MM4]
MNNIECSVAQIDGARTYQEDSYRIMSDLPIGEGRRGHLYVLCDGMGGHAGGGVASRLVCERFSAGFQSASGEPKERFVQGVQEANQSLAREIKMQPALKSMGSTLVAVWLEENRIWWISIGDSPLWLLRDGQLTRLNEDHSMTPVLRKMVDLGQMTQAAADTDGKRHILRSAVNGTDIRLMDISDQPVELQSDDQLILASDGVETMSVEGIRDVLMTTASHSCQQALSELMRQITARDFPEQDNASAILIKVSTPAWNTLSPGYRRNVSNLEGEGRLKAGESLKGEGGELARFLMRHSGQRKMWLWVVVVAIVLLLLIVTGVFV